MLSNSGGRHRIRLICYRHTYLVYTGESQLNQGLSPTANDAVRRMEDHSRTATMLESSEHSRMRACDAKLGRKKVTNPKICVCIEHKTAKR